MGNDYLTISLLHGNEDSVGDGQDVGAVCGRRKGSDGEKTCEDRYSLHSSNPPWIGYPTEDIFTERENRNAPLDEEILLKRNNLLPDALLLLTATIWGFAFVAQRAGMEHMGPFLFNGVRFALGSAVLIPLLLARRSRMSGMLRSAVPGGLIAGLILFGGASLQQAGLVFTTAGKAGFITGLYVVIVPLLGFFWKQKTGSGTWVGTLLAVAGLCLLSVRKGLSFAPGDLMVLAGAFFWAAHVQVIGHYTRRLDPIALALVQFMVCSVLSIVAALAFETVRIQSLSDAALPLGYSGFLSVGIAYTLQIVAQRRANPSHAAIIMSLETVAAALGGWIVLSETMSNRSIAGCALMLAGMVTSRFAGKRTRR